MTTPRGGVPRRLLLLALVLVASLGPAAAPAGIGAVGGSAHLRASQDAVPADGQPFVLTAEDRPRVATPRGEQVLRLAGPTQGPQSLDPALARDLSTNFLARQVFRGLTRLDGQLRPVPELAERIEISPDGLDYRFTLRPGAAFHDGRPLRAEDVVFSLTRALDPATAGGDAGALGAPAYLADVVGAADLTAGRATGLAGIAAPDERTVTIRLAAPRATFLMKLAAAPVAVVDRAQLAADPDWWRAPNGSGPFRVLEWAQDERLVLSRADGYVGGPPALERVEVRLGPGANAPFNLYQTDEVDLAEVPDASRDLVLSPDHPLRPEVTVVPLYAQYYLAFRADTPPMDDPHVRRAVQLAFPREKIAAVTFRGHVEPADGLVPEGMLGADWPAPVEPYDPDAARRELAASRYGSADRVPTLRIYGNGGGAPEALRDVLAAELGLDVEVVSVDWPEFLAGLAEGRYPAYGLYWGADYPDPEALLWVLFGGESPDNYVGYRSAPFDALLTQARAELDPARRAALYAEAQRLLLADHVVLPVYDDVGYVAAKPHVRGLELTALGILGLESVWLEH